MKSYWYYLEHGYSREQAEEKLLQLGFESENRGYVLQEKSKPRIRANPSVDCFVIYSTTKGDVHRMTSGNKKEVMRIIEKLNENP